MNSHPYINKLICKQLTDKWSKDELEIYLQQCISLVAGFREKIKGYSKEDLIILKNYIKAYLTIEQHALIHKDYLNQVESQLKSMER
jgi:cytochrome c2